MVDELSGKAVERIERAWRGERRAQRGPGPDRGRAGLPVRYALLVSLRPEAVAADIYTPIATQIGVPVEVVT